MNSITPSDGLTITENVRLNPGTYVLPKGIEIAADNVTVEAEGVIFIGSEHQGVGLYAKGRTGVTVRGLALQHYYHGIRFDDCHNVMLENITVRDTYEIEGIDTFLYLWQPLAEVYAGAILFSDVHDGAIRKCDLQHQMNGIMLYDSSKIRVEQNNASFNSGWGVYLSASNDTIIQDNRLDFCNRVYRRPDDGSIRVEADTAGIVLVQGSSRNHLLRNSCLCGGDGIFIAGYRHPGDINPCNDNLIEDNDCRLSPNNAIESTFSRGNVFRRNDCSRSNYGFWMGYSWDNILEDNIIEFNRFVGVAAEHAYAFTLRNNSIRLNGEGVRLWTRGGAVLPYWPGHEVCFNFKLIENTFEANHTGFAGYTPDDVEDALCHGFSLERNTFRDNRVGAKFKRVRDCHVRGNDFSQNVQAAIQVEADAEVEIDANTFAANLLDVAR